MRSQEFIEHILKYVQSEQNQFIELIQWTDKINDEVQRKDALTEVRDNLIIVSAEIQGVVSSCRCAVNAGIITEDDLSSIIDRISEGYDEINHVMVDTGISWHSFKVMH